MALYRVNKNAQDNGDHEVHGQQCPYWPMLTNYISRGEHATCQRAVREAKKHYPATANGCAICSPTCHTS